MAPNIVPHLHARNVAPEHRLQIYEFRVRWSDIPKVPKPSILQFLEALTTVFFQLAEVIPKPRALRRAARRNGGTFCGKEEPPKSLFLPIAGPLNEKSGVNTKMNRNLICQYCFRLFSHQL